MSDLNPLLKPVWGAEKWIAEGWDALTAAEKTEVTERVEALFPDGLPFKLVHDKILYIYAFSLLAQLEVLAIQVPLKFEPQMKNPAFKARMRQQLVDEVFHGVVFTRIVYELVAPYAMPPAYDDGIEDLCNFIREESEPQMALVLLNLVGEALIEEMFRAFYQAGVAPHVFSVILEDEHRHVCEAELYRELGLPPRKALKTKLEILEQKLIASLFSNTLYMRAMLPLISAEGLDRCFNIVDEKHKQQLSTLRLLPGVSWQLFMKNRQFIFTAAKDFEQHNYPIEMSATRQLLMTQWDDPSDPTMVAEFDLNIDCLHFFEKKYRPETLTMLMVQAVSQALSEHALYRTYLSHYRLYQSDKAYVALVVKLPDCGDHLGTMVFCEPHKMSLNALIARVKQNLQMMVYCYQKRMALEAAYPELVLLMDEVMYEAATGVYPYPMPGNPFVSVSNNGFAGYARAKSPLRVNEVLKLTLLGVQRKPVWNEASGSFEPQDSLPVSVSADHRVFNGDVPVPEYLTEAFHRVFDAMLDTSDEAQGVKPAHIRRLTKKFDLFIKADPKIMYKLLVALQTVWPDFIDLNAWVDVVIKARLEA
ncbi:MAG: hypothetical protein P1U32_00590 [Legionellaceae bacterium]|nr:hypothetical protein [Legionellaceae bacterium]